MKFRGETCRFDSPVAAIAGMLEHLRLDATADKFEAIGLASARGRVLADEVLADRDSPAFDYSAMDGYAVRAADFCAAPSTAEARECIVVGEARIGRAPPVLPHASTSIPVIRIATGAPIPRGADAVVRREDVEERAHAAEAVELVSIGATVARAISTGDNIRRQGENARKGEAVLARGSIINAAGLGSLAAVGTVLPRVHSRVRVAVLTTGDELVAASEIPEQFAIRNSNAAAISGVLGAHAWVELIAAEVLSSAHVVDEEGALDAALRAVIDRVDVVVMTGGVSMGHRDPVRSSLERLGATVVFHGLPQRPGKPMLGAVLHRENRRSVALFGLPGNPISAMVTCTRIVLPVLASIGGMKGREGASVVAPRQVPLVNADGKSLELWWHRLARLNSAGEAELVTGRGSGDIIAGGRSDGFVELPPMPSGGAQSERGGSAPIVSFFAWPT